MSAAASCADAIRLGREALGERALAATNRRDVPRSQKPGFCSSRMALYPYVTREPELTNET
jgi:hypothetical protein